MVGTNGRLRVLCVFGTRPEAIKLAPVIRQLKATDQIETRVCVTGQHREMLDQVLALFDIVPDYDLNIMRPRQTLSEVASRVLLGLDAILSEAQPDWLLVQGDTTTVMAASLAAFHRGIAVGHVEAGLRTRNKRHPFPEEVNRRVTSVIADRHFAPTELARQNLIGEGVDDQTITVTGNTVIDALLDVVHRPYDWQSGPLGAIPRHRRILLVTAHRRESFGEPIRNICAALVQLAQTYEDSLQIVYPVHLNPNIRQPVLAALSHLPNVSLLDPLEYLPMVHLIQAACVVLTDSGGLQEEAPSLGKPVLVMRETTERPEAIEAGTAQLVGTDPDHIVAQTRYLLDDPIAYAAMANAVNPFGDGQASARIVDTLLHLHDQQGQLQIL